MVDANERVDVRYKKGYLSAYNLALNNIERGASVEELRKFVAAELKPWAEDTSSANRFVPAPAFKRWEPPAQSRL